MAATERRRAQVGALREARHALHREGARTPAQAIDRLAGAARAGAREPPRAGRAQEALPAAEGLERARGVLRRAGQVGRAGPRARAPGRERGRRGARRALEQDRRAVPRSPEQGRSRAEGVREGAVASTPRTCRAAAGADPALREGEGGQAARRGAADRARPRTRAATSATPRMQRLAELLDMGARRQARRAAHRAAGARRDADRRVGDHDLAAAGRRRAAAGRSWSRPTRRRCRACSTTSAAGGAARCWRRWRRPTKRELANPEAAIARNQTILEIAPKDPEAVAALERLYIATGRFADLLAVYDKKLALAKSKAEELEIRFKLASLYEEEIKQPDKAIELYTRSCTRTRRSCRRWRRSIASISSSGAGRSCRRRSSRRSICRPTWPRSRS